MWFDFLVCASILVMFFGILVIRSGLRMYDHYDDIVVTNMLSRTPVRIAWDWKFRYLAAATIVFLSGFVLFFGPILWIIWEIRPLQ